MEKIKVNTHTIGSGAYQTIPTTLDLLFANKINEIIDELNDPAGINFAIENTYLLFKTNNELIDRLKTLEDKIEKLNKSLAFTSVDYKFEVCKLFKMIEFIVKNTPLQRLRVKECELGGALLNDTINKIKDVKQSKQEKIEEIISEFEKEFGWFYSELDAMLKLLAEYKKDNSLAGSGKKHKEKIESWLRDKLKDS